MPDTFPQLPRGVLFPVIFLLLTLVSCEKEEGLLDPLETGRWVRYTTSDGLAGNTVRDIYEDRQGNIWFATGNGVSKFNGKSWTTYNTSNSQLGHNSVWAIIQDRDDDMWFGTSTGIYFFVNNSQWLFFGGESGQMDVNAFYRDKDDWIWTGTEGDGFYIYDNTGFSHGLFNVGNDEINFVNDIAQDSKGWHWLATDFGVLYWNGSSWQWIGTDNGLPHFNVLSLHPDSKGRLWFGTSGGEDLAYGEGTKITSVKPFNGQPNIFIYDIAEDPDGNLWFATMLDGVIRYDGAVMHSFKPYNGYPAEDNLAVLSDSKGNIWFGTIGYGAVKYIPPVVP